MDFQWSSVICRMERCTTCKEKTKLLTLTEAVQSGACLDRGAQGHTCRSAQKNKNSSSPASGLSVRDARFFAKYIVIHLKEINKIGIEMYEQFN